MDPVSIAASACGIANLCGTIIVNVSKFVVGMRGADESLLEFSASISTLREILGNVESVVSQRSKQLLFVQKQERKHGQDIKKVLEACNRCLYRLKQELPDPPDENKGRTLQQARIQISLTIKSNIFVEIRGHIASYTQVLQLSLTTMTLGSMWEAQQSQELVHSTIQKLTSEIQATNNLLQRNGQDAEPDPDDDLGLEEISVKRNIEAWRESAESLAAAVTFYEPDEQSIADRFDDSGTRKDMHCSPEDEAQSGVISELGEPRAGVIDCDKSISQPDSGIAMSQEVSDSEWDPEPDIEDSLSVDILQFQIKANQKNVNHLINSGLFFQAEVYQKKGIELQDLLERTHKIPFLNRMDAEETLADILIKQGAKDGMSRAKDILQRLLQQEVSRNLAPNEDHSRRWRLYHKVGAIYLEFDFVVKAKKFVTRALRGRKEQEPLPMDLVRETATLLIRACQLHQDFDEAEGIRRWLHELEVNQPGIGMREQIDTPPSNPATADVLRWCKDRGFDVDSPNFHFNQRNAEGKTPLHVAVSDEKLDIVEQIVDHVKTLEARDSDSRTPLLLACGTLNRRTTRVLLKKGARIDVVDVSLDSPLHRVQNASGGIAVAQLLLDHSGQTINIDQKNNSDSTPLHLACKLGNEAMVELLLDRKADLNCRGPAACTPLLVAIYNRRVSIVKKLLERGADISVRDSSGHDAMAAAKAANSVSPEIRKFIQAANSRQRSDHLRRMSYASTVEETTGRTRGSVSSSEWNRRDTSATLVDDMGQIARVPSASSMQRKETFISEASASSDGSVGFMQSSHTLDQSVPKSLKSSKLLTFMGKKK